MKPELRYYSSIEELLQHKNTARTENGVHAEKSSPPPPQYYHRQASISKTSFPVSVVTSFQRRSASDVACHDETVSGAARQNVVQVENEGLLGGLYGALGWIREKSNDVSRSSCCEIRQHAKGKSGEHASNPFITARVERCQSEDYDSYRMLWDL